jgi:hypothetical protein
LVLLPIKLNLDEYYTFQQKTNKCVVNNMNIYKCV